MNLRRATDIGAVDSGSLEPHSLGSLRFTPSLEFQFVFSKVSLSLQILRSSCAFALALYPAFLAYDYLTTQAYVWQWSVLLSFFLSTVTSTVILVATYKPELYRYLPQLVPASLGLNALALIACVVNLQRSGVYFPYEILVLNQLYSYFLCGLLFRIAVPLAMFTCIAWWAAGLWLTDLTGFVTHGLVLLTITLLGAVTCFYNERIERRAWFQGRQLARVGIRDDLTGLFNDHHLRDQGGRIVAQARRAQAPVSVLSIGIDSLDLRRHLQGRAAGDATLRAAAGLIGATGRRPLDLAARTDRERFAVVLYDCDGLSAYGLAQQLCGKVTEFDANQSTPGLLPLKLSVGVACSDPTQPQSIEQLVDSAARALAKARLARAGSSPIHLG